jgi:hypothetical protein
MASTYKPRIDHSKKDYESEASDMAQDKKVVKKAFKMHEEQAHGGEKTDLSKLKKGGRAKMKGTVRTYKAGGLIGVKSDDKQPNAKSPKKSVEKYNKGGACY